MTARLGEICGRAHEPLTTVPGQRKTKILSLMILPTWNKVVAPAGVTGWLDSGVQVIYVPPSINRSFICYALSLVSLFAFGREFCFKLGL